MRQPSLTSPLARAAPDASARWPIGWTLLGAFGVSGLMWWGLIALGGRLLGG